MKYGFLASDASTHIAWLYYLSCPRISIIAETKLSEDSHLRWSSSNEYNIQFPGKKKDNRLGSFWCHTEPSVLAPDFSKKKF